MIDDSLLALTVCPSGDRGSLRFGGRSSGQQADSCLECAVCATRYPIVDGIPVLLPRPGARPPIGEGA